MTRAADFAARRHAEQRRKGASREPSINHLVEVAEWSTEATDGRDAGLVAAGFLHAILFLDRVFDAAVVEARIRLSPRKQ